jgi:hypothetical protein
VRVEEVDLQFANPQNRLTNIPVILPFLRQAQDADNLVEAEPEFPVHLHPTSQLHQLVNRYPNVFIEGIGPAVLGVRPQSPRSIDLPTFCRLQRKRKLHDFPIFPAAAE